MQVFGMILFKTVDKPKEFGWILRPSQHKWNSFVLQLDKLLADNIQTSALNALKAPKVGEEGNKLGTLKRLAMSSTASDVSLLEKLLKRLEDGSGDNIVH